MVTPVAALPFVLLVAASAELSPRWVSVCLGVALGATLTMYAAISDSPPEWIDKWRRGRDGERKTANRLRRLRSPEWTAIHDIADRALGNIDHVVVGPAGIFALETKALSGELAVEGDTVTISHGSESIDQFDNRRLAGQARRNAAHLKQWLSAQGVSGVPWVQAVVVLWGAFDQRRVDGDRVVWLHGNELAAWLAEQPPRLNGPQLEAAIAALRDRVSQSASR